MRCIFATMIVAISFLAIWFILSQNSRLIYCNLSSKFFSIIFLRVFCRFSNSRKNCDADNKWHSSDDYDTSEILCRFLCVCELLSVETAHLWKNPSTNLMIQWNHLMIFFVYFASNSVPFCSDTMMMLVLYVRDTTFSQQMRRCKMAENVLMNCRDCWHSFTILLAFLQLRKCFAEFKWIAQLPTNFTTNSVNEFIFIAHESLGQISRVKIRFLAQWVWPIKTNKQASKCDAERLQIERKVIVAELKLIDGCESSMVAN